MTKISNYSPEGYHAIVEHKGQISHLGIESLEELLRAMAFAANANVIGANFHDFGNGVGNTGVLLLAESHISIHTWPEVNYAAIDIFLCSDRVSMNHALDVMKKFDANGHFQVKIIERSHSKAECDAQ